MSSSPSDAQHALQPAVPRCACGSSARWGGLVLVLLLVGLAVYGGTRWYEQRKANWGVVVPGRIYRSAEIPRGLVRSKLQENNISVIVFLSSDEGGDKDLAAERQAARELNVPILNFPMRGDGVAARPNDYVEALCAVHEANRQGKAVLIHCHSGAQRTGGVVAVYRMLVQGWSPQDAYAEMQRYGHDPRRNAELVPFINQNIGQWADALVQRKVIDRVPSPMPKIVP